MNLRVIQNEVGKFNWLNQSEKSLSFSMGLYEEGKLIEENGIKARIYYSGEPDDKSFFDDPFDNLEDVFQKCFDYSDRVISSTDYRAECLLFSKLYCSNYEQIDAQLVADKKERIEKKIAELQKELTYNTAIPDLSDISNYVINKKVQTLEKWLAIDQKEQDQVKEGTEKYSDLQKKIDRRKKEIGTLKSHLITSINN